MVKNGGNSNHFPDIRGTSQKTIDKIRTSTKNLIEKMQNKGTDESEEDPIIHESEV